ncbi:MAG: MMPL family transporter, partial [Verrucomicrobia bacterium]|nr:MMPL family transporter [Verrucomicrobiota bacterium]
LLIPNLRFEFFLSPILEGDHEKMEQVREFYQAFPPAEGHAVIAVSSSEAISIEDLRQASRWADQLEALPEVKKVYSPGTLLEMKFQGFNLDEWARLSGSDDVTLEIGDGPGMSTIRGRLLSHDMQSIALHVEKQKGVRLRDFIGAIRDESANWQKPVRVLGTSILLSDMKDTLRRDLNKMVGLLLLALVLVLPLFFRSFRMAYLPLLTAMTGQLIYLGALSAAGQALGMIHLAGPLLIMVIGLSDSVHMQRQFDEARARGSDRSEAMKIMLRGVGVACVLTSLTTAIGFLSLTLTGHEEVRRFGLWCAAGVGISFFSAMVFLPVALAFFPGRGGEWLRGNRFPIDAGRLQRLAVPTLAVLIAISMGVFWLKVDTSISNELPLEAESVRDLQWFAQNFQGTDRVEVEINAALDDPKVFAAVEKLQSELSSVEGVVGSSSYADVIRFMLSSDVIETKDGPYLGVRALGELPVFPKNLLNRSADRACVVFYVTGDFGSNQFNAFEKRFDEITAEMEGAMDISINGYTAMAYRSVNLITETLFRSLGFSLIAITVVLALALRSPLLALICLIPNALPLFVAAGFAGWLDIPLRMGVAIIFSVGLGLAVDDTIHLMVRFRQINQSGEEGKLRAHLNEALASAGFAIVLSSVVLLLSASVFLQSDFTSMRDTGIILAVITISALLTDLIVLPWIIERCARFVNYRGSHLS